MQDDIDRSEGISAFGIAAPTVQILDVPVHSITAAQSLELIEQFTKIPRLHQIATVNPEFVMKAQEDKSFLEILQGADLCLADGIGLVLASRWLNQPLPERVAGSDLVYEIAALAAKRNWRLFLLGAAAGVAKEAANVLSEQFQDLAIVGTYSGSPDIEENDRIVELINESQANILYVAFGAPKQDIWIYRNRNSLSSVRVAMGVGGSLDFITGRATRAPKWIQNLGLEWLHRLYQEPWRWRRMTALPRFAVRILLHGKNHL